MNNLDALIEDLGIDNIQWRIELSDTRSLLFYKINDEDPDGHKRFLERIKNQEYGFIFAATNKKYELKNGVSYLPLDRWYEVQEYSMDRLYPIKNHPKFIAVTGTNGKTTTTDFIRQICVQSKVDVLCIGTLGVWYNEKKESDFGLTTPNYIDLRKYIHKYEAKVVTFEASSHSITQKRFFNIKLDAAAWTSFSQDHLDYHKTMHAYYEAKLGLKDYLSDGANFYYHKEDHASHKDTKGLLPTQINLITSREFLSVNYNKKNLELAVTCLKDVGVPILESYDFINPVPGRFNTYKSKGNIIVIDYAHTPDAIENICIESKKAFKKRVVTLFGCGGDRDKLKRPLMGKVACANSDDVIITTDNPRFEDPEKIIEEITEGIKEKSNYKVIIDRENAIKTLLKEKDSVLLILGKGNEPYLDIKGAKVPYSDIELVEKLINE